MSEPPSRRDRTTGVGAGAGGEAPIDSRWAIDVCDLYVARGGRTILDGVSCRIASGCCAAILGPNGCGKTTFSRVLTGRMLFGSGRVRVLGETLGRCDVSGLRRRIGLVHPSLDRAAAHHSGATVDADLTAREAVCTGFFATVGLYDRPTAGQVERAEHVLDQVGLGRRMDQPMHMLSTGEQRRALIARSLVSRPELLILDEPTAGLDIAGREQVLATIDRILRSERPPTVLFITHHVEELPPSTWRVLLMREGRFTHAGPPTEVITPERLSSTFGCRVYVRRERGRFWLEVLPEAWLELLKDPK